VLRPLFELQARWSRIPAADEVLIEHTRTREGMHWFVFPFEGRLVHEGLAALVAYRLSRRAAATIQLAGNDYGFELLPSDSPELDTSAWRALLSPDQLAEDLLACVNATQMARRQFREIARVAGLIYQGYPGQHKAARHLQASSELFFDVFSEYDPENLLLTQARREVLQQQLEFHRLESALTRIAESELVIVESQRLSPLAFPLWAERLRAQYVSSEKWSDRVERMAQQLARAADGGKSPRRAVAQPR
jgi:ATP-dependent Lhr-like helicase